MSYTFIHQITNSNKIIQDKVNFFADIFEYNSQYVGNLRMNHLENHRSLLIKINFQLENYTIYSQKYIEYYFSNIYLKKSDLLIKEFYFEEWKEINELKYKFDSNRKDEASRKKLIKSISELISKLEKTLFKNSLDRVISIIQCNYPLEKHNHVELIQYYTPILVSEFMLYGFAKKDLQTIFSKILSRDLKIENKKVETDIPLPKNILELKYNQNDEESANQFYKAVENYLRNRTLKQQFEGIYNIFQFSQTKKTYLFRISNIIANADFNFKYSGVRISNQFRSEYITKRRINKLYREFFYGKGQLFAEVSIMANNNDMGLLKSKEKVNKALKYLSAFHNKTSEIEPGNYIIKDIDNNLRHKSMSNNLHPHDYKSLNEYDISKRFGDKKNLVIIKFINLESIYIDAKTAIQKEMQLVNYWRYIESFFEYENYDAKKIMNDISRVLSKHSLIIFKLNCINHAQRIFYNDVFRSESSNKNFRILFENGISKKQIIKLQKATNHPFISEELNWLIDTDDNSKENEACKFYKNILFEAYEQRNFIEHSGIYNEISVDKILITLPEMVMKVRWLVLQKLLKKNYTDFRLVLEGLAK